MKICLSADENCTRSMIFHTIIHAEAENKAALQQIMSQITVTELLAMFGFYSINENYQSQKHTTRGTISCIIISPLLIIKKKNKCCSSKNKRLLAIQKCESDAAIYYHVKNQLAKKAAKARLAVCGSKVNVCLGQIACRAPARSNTIYAESKNPANTLHFVGFWVAGWVWRGESEKL